MTDDPIAGQDDDDDDNYDKDDYKDDDDDDNYDDDDYKCDSAGIHTCIYTYRHTKHVYLLLQQNTINRV